MAVASGRARPYGYVKPSDQNRTRTTAHGNLVCAWCACSRVRSSVVTERGDNFFVRQDPALPGAPAVSTNLLRLQVFLSSRADPPHQDSTHLHVRPGCLWVATAIGDFRVRPVLISSLRALNSCPRISLRVVRSRMNPEPARPRWRPVKRSRKSAPVSAVENAPVEAGSEVELIAEKAGERFYAVRFAAGRLLKGGG